MQNRIMNKNEIKWDKREEEEALSLFLIFWSLLKFWRRSCMEISAALRRGFFTEEDFQSFGYSRIFLSLAQALDMEISLTLISNVSLTFSRVEIMGLYKL